MAKRQRHLNIPFHIPNVGAQAKNALSSVLASHWITTGPKVKEFEAGMKRLLAIKDDVLAVSSGTAALHLAYLSLNLKKGDEIIVPSFTFCSTINMIVHAGGTPVFCDIDPVTLCADPQDVKKKITAKTKAIVVVHFAGMPADLDRFHAIARQRGITIIEDAAHAILTRYKGKYIGTHKNISCFSFYATKTLTTAEGGLITMPNHKSMEHLRELALHGMSKSAWSRYSPGGSWKYQVVAPGFKYNMSDVHAAIGLSQLPAAKADLKKRVSLVAAYRKKLRNVRGLMLPQNPPFARSSHAWHLFTIQVHNEAIRDALIEHLKMHGIGASVHFIPNHLQPYYQKRMKAHLPVTERVGKTILSLPLYSQLTLREVHYITQTIKDFLL